jgi:cysteine desulfurase
MAMGVPVDIAKGTIRITLSETNTKDEIDKVINTIKKNVEELRKII